MPANILVTAHRGLGKSLIKELKDLGNFRETDFRDVLLGEVDDLTKFLEETDKRTSFLLSRIVPIEKSFYFSPEKALEVFKSEVKPFLDRIKGSETFCVRVERRGMKGIISSRDIEREVGTFIQALIEERNGIRPRVNLEDPDKMIIFETLGNWCGIGLISKEMRKRYFYLRL